MQVRIRLTAVSSLGIDLLRGIGRSGKIALPQLCPLIAAMEHWQRKRLQ
jgi:hypothetical protein